MSTGVKGLPLALSFGLVILLGAAPSRAEWSEPLGPLLLPGVNVGSAAGQGPATFLVGAELSIAKGTEGFAWFGAYADAVWLPDRDRVRFDMGPEFGFLMFGVDGGPVLEIDERGSRGGIQVRPLLSFVFVHFYARFGRTYGDHGSDFRELGLLLKYPIDLKELSRTIGLKRWGWRRPMATERKLPLAAAGYGGVRVDALKPP